MISSATPINIF